MHPKNTTPSKYVRTSYVAKLLNVSVGTVQKLVDQGQLSAYLTSGGHRRISHESVIKYGQKNKIPMDATDMNRPYTADTISICVLFKEKEITMNLAKIIKAGKFQVVSDPMKLIRTAGEIKHIFIDAHIEWMNWQQMERSSSDVHYVVYNSAVLSNLSRQHLEKLALLIDDDISIELLNGYCLGLKAKFDAQSTQSFINIIQQ